MKLQRATFLVAAAAALMASAGTEGTAAAQSLVGRIDALIAERAGGGLAPPTDDLAFLRRATLDLAGRIPTAAEARRFLDASAPDKRAREIDRLLASEAFTEHQADQLHIQLMERLGRHDLWREYLRRSVAANKPWDQLVRELLNPDADVEENRGAGFFYTKRLEKYGQNPVDMPGLVRDIGRLFLGVDVQCAQCHDHLFVDDYKQRDFQGLLAFVDKLALRSDTDFPAVAEQPLTAMLEFVSVFGGEKQQTGPRLPDGREFPIPPVKRGEEYSTPPDRKTRFPGVLKFSRVQLLSEELPRGDNALFTRNLANRLWWQFMGRGLVEPLDLHHSSNPPSHPELLELLSQAAVARQMDLRLLIRELMLTDVYQRSTALPEGAFPEGASPEEASPEGASPEGASLEAVPEASYRIALERPLSAEQLLRSVLTATGELERFQRLPRDGEARKSIEELADAFRQALAAPPREPETGHRPSVRAALFLMHSEEIQELLQPRPGNLLSRLSALPDDEVAAELYLTVLTRVVSAEEQAAVTQYLAARPDRRSAALANLAWSLLASNEFLLNH